MLVLPAAFMLLLMASTILAALLLVVVACTVMPSTLKVYVSSPVNVICATVATAALPAATAEVVATSPVEILLRPNEVADMSLIETINVSPDLSPI